MNKHAEIVTGNRMKLNTKNLIWATAHPLRALRYLRHRDTIPYGVIARYLPEDPVILEAGAANGINTCEMADFWPQANLHAFEPVPSAKRELDQRVTGYGSRVRTYALGLGAEIGALEMNVSGANGEDGTQSSSLLRPTGHFEEYENVEFNRTLEIEVTTIDEWAASEAIERVDFMWLDLQGYEIKVLSGALRILPSVSAIHIEVQHRQLYDDAPLYPDVRRWLHREGFSPKVDATSRVAGNVLFIRS